MAKVVPLINNSYNEGYYDQYLVMLNAKTESAEFVDRCGVIKGSYAARVAEDIWRSLFKRSVDLKWEYDRYFSVEYPTFNEYILNNYNFDEDALKTLGRHYDNFSHVLLFKPYQGFLHEEDGKVLLRLLVKEITHEG